MSINTDPQKYCDKCGRIIPLGKSFIYYGGWLICGICQWEEERKQQDIYLTKALEEQFKDTCQDGND